MFATLFVVLACSLAVVLHANVIGIDFGSDSMKIGIVQPGLPLGKTIYLLIMYTHFIACNICRDCIKSSIKEKDSNMYHFLSK